MRIRILQRKREASQDSNGPQYIQKRRRVEGIAASEYAHGGASQKKKQDSLECKSSQLLLHHPAPLSPHPYHKCLKPSGRHAAREASVDPGVPDNKHTSAAVQSMLGAQQHGPYQRSFTFSVAPQQLLEAIEPITEWTARRRSR